MARRNITICDRCGRECTDRYDRRSVKKITVDEKEMDLCPSCASALGSWLQKDNTTIPGDSVEWEQVCTHQVPCAGPCNSGYWRKRR